MYKKNEKTLDFCHFFKNFYHKVLENKNSPSRARERQIRKDKIMTENVLLEKSKAFALKNIQLYKYLTEEKREYVLSKQLLRSATSIGANAREGSVAPSKADFFNKLNISLKEANESAYWLELLFNSGYIDEAMYTPLYNDCLELLRILTSITKHQHEYKNQKPVKTKID